jgi:hypothetical protein
MSKLDAIRFAAPDTRYWALFRQAHYTFLLNSRPKTALESLIGRGPLGPTGRQPWESCRIVDFQDHVTSGQQGLVNLRRVVDFQVIYHFCDHLLIFISYSQPKTTHYYIFRVTRGPSPFK